MTIYRLKYNNFEYPRIYISPDEIENKSNSGKSTLVVGKSRKYSWKILNGTYYYDPNSSLKNPCPDLSKTTGEMVFSEEAKSLLGDTLGKYGEFLPILIEGDRRYIFNILNATDAIDPFNSSKEMFEGMEISVEKIAFLENEVKDLFIFDTPYDRNSYIYCTDEFKSFIEDSGLLSGWSFHTEMRD